MKLRTQFGLAIAIITIILSGIVFAGFQLNKQSLNEQQRVQTTHTSEEIAEGLDVKLNDLKQTVGLRATNPAIAAHGTQRQHRALETTINETSFNGISVIHRNGTMTGIAAGLDAETRSQLIGSDFSERQYFQQAASGNTYVSEPVAAASGNYLVTVSAPIYKNGSIVGTLNAALYLQNSSFFRGVASSANSHHGVVIKSQSGEVIYEQSPTPDTELLIANTTVPQTGWVVQVQTSRTILASDLQSVTEYQYGAIAVVLLLLGGFGYVLYTRTLRYHERLLTGFGNLQNREYGKQLSEEVTADWRPIFSAFNEMSRELAAYETAHVEHQEHLQRERNRFQRLFESIPEPSVIVEFRDGNPLIKESNQAFDTTFGYEHTDTVGTNINDLILPEGENQTAREIDKRAADGESITREVRRETADGVRDFLLRTTPASHETQEFFGVYIDITEQKRQERELEETTNVLSSVIENLPVGILVEDADRTITTANQTLVDILNISETPTDLQGQDCAAAAEELSGLFADSKRFIRRIDEILETHEPVQNEELALADGRTLSRSYVSYAAAHGTGNIWLYRDITDQKQRVRRLERQEFLFNRTQEMADIGIWEYDIDAETLYWSDGVYDIHGIERAVEPTLDEAVSFYHPDDRDEIRNAVEQAIEQGGEYDRELRICREDGELRDVRARGETVVDDDGKTTKLRGTFQDITAQKKIERDLREYEIIVEAMADIAWVQDMDKNLTFVNNRIEDILHIAPESITGQHLSEPLRAADVAPADKIDKLEDMTYRIATGEEDTAQVELPLELPDGHITVDIRLTPVTYDGEIDSVVGIARNVTKQKQHESRLSEVNELTRELIQADTAQAIAERVVDSIQDLFGSSTGGCWLYDESENVLRPAAITAEARKEVGDPPIFEPGTSLSWDVFQSQEVTAYENIPAESARYNPETPIQSELIVPLGDYGVLNIGSVAQTSFDESAQSLAKILGANVESALELVETKQQLEQKEKRLDLALEGGQLGVWDWNIQMDEVTFDERWAEMLGHSLDEIDPNISAWEDRAHPDDLPEAEAKLESHFAGETEYYKCDHRMQTKSGDWIWVRDVGKVVRRDDDGTPLRAVGIHQDISTDKRRERQLRRTLEQSQKLIEAESPEEAANIAVEIAQETLSFPFTGVHLEEDGSRLEPVAVTDALRDSLGYAPTYHQTNGERKVDTLVWDVYESNETRVLSDIEQAESGLAHETPSESGIIHSLPGHGVFITSVDSSEGFDEFNHYLSELLSALLATTLDRIAYQQQLESQRDNLDLLNQIVRHDIRNYLQIMLGRLDLLADRVDQAHLEHLKPALDNAERAVELTQTARDLSNTLLEEQMESQPVNLHSVVDQEVDAVRAEDSNADIQVSESLKGTTVRANEMLDSVVRNLLKNAIRHNDKQHPEIEVSKTNRNGNVQLRVADNGPGVPDEQKESIFGKGEKGLESEGTGIGLYLVNTLTKNWGGEVWVEDNDPEGSVFVVELSKI
jgi:PAS domain S-box-containing protein